MWFKHRAWIPLSWVLSALNLAAVWFAAQPGEPAHATAHALGAVLFALAAQRLMVRQRRVAFAEGIGASEANEALTISQQVAALRAAQESTLVRLERAVEAIAIEVERVGENQRFLTKTLTERSKGE